MQEEQWEEQRMERNRAASAAQKAKDDAYKEKIGFNKVNRQHVHSQWQKNREEALALEGGVDYMQEKINTGFAKGVKIYESYDLPKPENYDADDPHDYEMARSGAFDNMKSQCTIKTLEEHEAVQCCKTVICGFEFGNANSCCLTSHKCPFMYDISTMKKERCELEPIEPQIQSNFHDEEYDPFCDNEENRGREGWQDC